MVRRATVEICCDSVATRTNTTGGLRVFTFDQCLGGEKVFGKAFRDRDGLCGPTARVLKCRVRFIP